MASDDEGLRDVVEKPRQIRRVEDLPHMRGEDSKQSSMLCLISPADRVPKDHPLRQVKVLADEALARLSEQFEGMYSRVGRPSIPPERLLKSMVLMGLYTIRSERQFCEQLEYNLLFRWFLDMDMVSPAFDATTFTKNRDRLLKHEIGREFLAKVLGQADEAGLLSSEHFSVDGTLIEACASLKSFRPKDEDDDPPGGDDGTTGSKSNRWVNFRGEKRSNETHESKTDPEAKLMRKGFGKEAKLSFAATALMENRNGLLVDLRIGEANGRAEVDASLEMIEGVAGSRRITVGADKGFDTKHFVQRCRELNATPHVAMNITRARTTNLDGRTVNYPGYTTSQRIRKRIEEIFGWFKTTGNFRRTRFKGVSRTLLAAQMTGAAYNLLRIARLTAG
jgi:transposase